ncbi:MAG TPA: biopolymer transporter ExbD [Candidatus Omnitrophota bacterium]|nr:biopolymer transporter ExbD [Candidatus Omnitrophota bacterium]
MRFEKGVSRKTHKGRSIDIIFFINIFIILLIFLFFFQYYPVSGGVPISLPKVISKSGFSKNKLIVTIPADNSFLFEGKKIEAGKLKDIISKNKSCEIFIKANSKAGIFSLVKVWNIARDAGCGQINIATDD